MVLSPSGDLSNTSSPSESYSPARAAIAVCDGAGTVVLSGGDVDGAGTVVLSPSGDGRYQMTCDRDCVQNRLGSLT